MANTRSKWGRGSTGPPPTIADVAKAAGTSRTTVSNVIGERGRISPETRAHVLKTMQALGYRPSAAARSLRGGATGVIGVVVGDLTDPFNVEIAAGIERQASEAGYTVLLVSSDAAPATEARRIETLIEHRVEAIVFITFSGSRSVANLIPSSIPVVFASARSSYWPSVTADDDRGVALAVEHLAGLGHKRIGYVGTGHPEPEIDAARFAAFTTAMARHKLKVREEAVVRWGLDGRASDPDTVGETLRGVLTQRWHPTAIFAASVRNAVRVIDAARTLERAVPRELSVVGFGDTEMTRMGAVRLTTIAQSNQEIARIAIEIATRRDSPPARGRRRDVVLEPSLQVRDTTAPPA